MPDFYNTSYMHDYPGSIYKTRPSCVGAHLKIIIYVGCSKKSCRISNTTYTATIFWCQLGWETLFWWPLDQAQAYWKNEAPTKFLVTTRLEQKPSIKNHILQTRGLKKPDSGHQDDKKNQAQFCNFWFWHTFPSLLACGCSLKFSLTYFNTL